MDSEQSNPKPNKAILAGVTIFGFAFVGITGGLCLSGTVNFAGRTKSLKDYGERLEFTMKYQFLGVLWLIFLIFSVVYKRMTSGAFNPLDGKDNTFRKQAQILQNSFEQFIISAFAQLSLIAFIDETYTLRAIPWVNFVFFIGRILFMVGYPNYRSAGMFCTIAPSIGMIGVCVYKFCEHLLT